jgi:hypothetical protein
VTFITTAARGQITRFNHIRGLGKFRDFGRRYKSMLPSVLAEKMEAIRRFGAIRRVERVGQRFFNGACKVVAVLITDQEPRLPTTTLHSEMVDQYDMTLHRPMTWEIPT